MILDYYLLRCIDFVKSGVLGLCNSFFIFKNKDKFLFFFIKKKYILYLRDNTRLDTRILIFFIRVFTLKSKK